MPVLELVTPTPQQTTKSSRSWIQTTPNITNFFSRTTRHPLFNIKNPLNPLTRPVTNYLTNHPEIFTIWLLLLLCLLTLIALIATGINQNARDRLWNYTIPLSPNIYLILANLTQSAADVIDFSIRSLHSFYELRRGAQTAEILFTDYAASLSSRGVFSIIPLVDVMVAWRRGHHLVCLSVLASLGITVVTVFLGPLQLSSSYYGATSFLGDQTAATGAAWLVGLAVVVYAALWWRVRRVLGGGGGRKMKRPVESVMGVAAYVVFSEGLREDLVGVAGLDVGRYDGGERARELERRGSRYAMGVWTDATGHVLYGVERQYDGRGRVDVSGVI